MAQMEEEKRRLLAQLSALGATQEVELYDQGWSDGWARGYADAKEFYRDEYKRIMTEALEAYDGI